MPRSPRPDGPVPLGGRGRPAVRAGALLREGRAPIGAGLAALSAVAYLGLTDPYRPGGHLVCPVLALTGLLCPACGAQRAVHSLAHGDLAAAWDMNPLLVVGAPVAAAAWVRWLMRAAGGRRPLPRVPRGTLAGRAGTALGAASPWLLLTVVVAFGVLRNVPALGPWLAP